MRFCAVPPVARALSRRRRRAFPSASVAPAIVGKSAVNGRMACSPIVPSSPSRRRSIRRAPISNVAAGKAIPPRARSRPCRAPSPSRDGFGWPSRMRSMHSATVSASTSANDARTSARLTSRAPLSKGPPSLHTRRTTRVAISVPPNWARRVAAAASPGPRPPDSTRSHVSGSHSLHCRAASRVAIGRGWMAPIPPRRLKTPRLANCSVAACRSLQSIWRPRAASGAR